MHRVAKLIRFAYYIVFFFIYHLFSYRCLDLFTHPLVSCYDMFKALRFPHYMKCFAFYCVVAQKSRHSVLIRAGAVALLEWFGEGKYVLSEIRYCDSNVHDTTK